MDAKRWWVGLGWGIVGTLAMSVVMIVGTLSGISPMPKPIPVALVARMLGPGLPKPALMALGAVSHLLYGGVFGGVLALLVSRVTVWKGILGGIALWLLMQLVWLPLLGWGPFGTAVTPKIAVATLILHLVYGATTGWLIARGDERRPASVTALGPMT
jgi:hypothetical protein